MWGLKLAADSYATDSALLKHIIFCHVVKIFVHCIVSALLRHFLWVFLFPSFDFFFMFLFKKMC
jgi:hypothetical protein